jgi:TPR repeat protein
MAGVAHDASGLEPAAIATQQTGRPATSEDRGKLRVFISYSRDDLNFADQLDAALSIYGFECLIDRHDISGGEDWKRRLGNLIRQADTIVFVLSPSSARSPICDWEVEEAARLNKRILPVNCRPLESASPPPRLRELNYIFFYQEPKLPGSGFGTGLASLIAALNTDFDWLRDHTRYLQRAIEWDTGGRPANRLLSGDDIAEAKAWAAHRPKSAPEPTPLQLDFIHASEVEAEARLSEQRKQLEAVAAAQAARETALHEAEEALKQRATVARVRNIALVALSILAVLAVSVSVLSAWLYARAKQEQIVAEQQKEQADDILAHAANIIVSLGDRTDVKTQQEAFAVFQAGARHGAAIAMYDLGVFYQNGIGVSQDYAKARELLEKAAAKDDPAAMYNLGIFYENGSGVQQDYGKARGWFEKAAANDFTNAMYNLGLLYHDGLGVQQDYGKSREWYEKAAAKDNAMAMTNLGALFEHSEGVPQDYATAREWFEKAAAKDNEVAMYNLGMLFGNGFGVQQDYGKAREWWEKAAAKGVAEAMFDLGVLYENGFGVQQDYGKAHEWYEKAAAKDNVLAMYNLGSLFGNGEGVSQDYAKAREWYEKAAAKGSADAKMALERLPIEEAETAGRYDEALRLAEVLETKVEAVETKSEGRPGVQTAKALSTVTWLALFAKDFTKALTIADRDHALLPNNLAIETNRAHALMFVGHDGEAKALYLAHKGDPVSEANNRLWEQLILQDFAKFRKAGLTHPMMADIEKELGISR